MKQAKQDFPNILISFVFGVMILILGSVLLMAIEPQEIISHDLNVYGGYPAVVFHGGIHNGWLRVERFNTQDQRSDFNPCYVQIQSDFRPVITKVGTKYSIAFVSDIGKDDLP